MSASVTYSGTQFTIKITNVTTGKSFSKSSRVSGAKRTSAEWIAEAPCCTRGGGILPLADFGTVDLGSRLHRREVGPMMRLLGAISGPISTFGSSVFSITMVSSAGANEAVPSTLTKTGPVSMWFGSRSDRSWDLPGSASPAAMQGVGTFSGPCLVQVQILPVLSPFLRVEPICGWVGLTFLSFVEHNTLTICAGRFCPQTSPVALPWSWSGVGLLRRLIFLG